MNNLIIVSQDEHTIPQLNTLKTDLMKRDFYIWDGDALTRGSDEWWRLFEEALEDCTAFIALMVPVTKESAHAARELRLVRAHNIAIIPLLVAGDPSSSIPDDLIASGWIDISTPEKYSAGVEKLIERLFKINGIDRQSVHPTVVYEMQQIRRHIADIRWMRIISIDGLSHPNYHFDTDPSYRDTYLDFTEDRVSAVSTGSLSFSERIAGEFRLGTARFVVNAGQFGTHFSILLGDGSKWFFSMLINGQPSIDAIIQYFKDRDFLATITPFIKMS